MSPLAIKCYLPGRRTQYLLSSHEDLSIEIGAGADLCPRDFDAGVRVQLRSVDEQWFVTPQMGAVLREDGSTIDGPSALSLPAMLLAGSTTLVLDTSADPRIPTRLIQGSAEPSGSPDRQPQVAPPQPPLAPRQPGVAPLRAPELPPLIEPSVVVSQVELPAQRELTETRIFDMAQLGASALSQPPAVSPEEIEGPRAWLAAIRKQPRLLAYAVLGVALVAFQVRAHRAPSAAPAAPATSLSAPLSAASAAPPPPAAPSPVVNDGFPSSPRRAAELFAVGDLVNAQREYRALAASPSAPPVFGVIAHALEQRIARQAKP